MVAHIVVTVVVSLVQVLLVWGARVRWGLGGTPVAAGLLAFLSLFLASWPLLLQAALTFAVSVVCLFANAKPRSVLLAATGAMVAAYAYLGVDVWQKHQEILALQRTYPVVSLEDRLAYEGTNPPDDDVAPAIPAGLAEVDPGHSFRQEMLRRLHEQSVEYFVRSFGFGVVRMIRFHPSYLERRIEEQPPAERLPLAPGGDTYGESNLPEFASIPATGDWRGLHETGLMDFFDGDRIGYVASFRKAAGFEPHAMFYDPSNGPRAEWAITRLELVSLLKHDVPVAYVSESLPRMEELASARTRALDEFETSALEQLRTERDIVVDSEPGHVRMVGSIRAGESCLGCHAVRRGELLGAFTYELHPRELVRPWPE